MLNDQLRLIQSFEQVIKILGGPTAVARRLGRTPQQVCQWRSRHGTIPAELYPKTLKALKAKGYKPDPRLFRFEFDELQAG